MSNANDDDFDDGEIERLLRSAPLRPPSPDLDARVMRSCRPTPWRRPALAAAAVMAVATGIGVAMHHHAPAAPRATPTKIVKSTPLPLTPPSAAATALPMNILQTFGGVRNEGIVGTTPDGDPVRRIRRKTVRQVVVIDPRTGQHLTVTVPHEEVFLVRIRAF